jgi:hypothetical protein
MIFGALLASGHSLDQILDMSWDQIGLMGECILIHKYEMLNSLIEPVMVSMGGQYKSGKVNRNSKKHKTNKSKLTPKQREELLVHQFASAGIPIGVKS